MDFAKGAKIGRDGRPAPRRLIGPFQADRVVAVRAGAIRERPAVQQRFGHRERLHRAGRARHETDHLVPARRCRPSRTTRPGMTLPGCRHDRQEAWIVGLERRLRQGRPVPGCLGAQGSCTRAMSERRRAAAHGMGRRSRLSRCRRCAIACMRISSTVVAMQKHPNINTAIMPFQLPSIKTAEDRAESAASRPGAMRYRSSAPRRQAPALERASEPGYIACTPGDDAHVRRRSLVTAALLVIGDEILSGRTKDKNIGYIADYLHRDRHRPARGARRAGRRGGDRRGGERAARALHLCLHHRRHRPDARRHHRRLRRQGLRRRHLA